MARRASARNVAMGDWMRATGGSLGDAHRWYEGAHGGGTKTRAKASTAPTPIREGIGDLFGPRENPSGGIGTGTLLLAGVVAYVAVPSVRTAVNNAIGSLSGAVSAAT